MNEELNKKLKQIVEVLSQENIPESLKGLVSLLGSSAGGEESKNEDLKKDDKSSSMEETEAVRKIRSVIQKVNSKNDPRVNLLNALKPFMNKKRKYKLDTCVKLIYIANLLNFIEEYEKE